jgi:hypothetical protein
MSLEKTPRTRFIALLLFVLETIVGDVWVYCEFAERSFGKYLTKSGFVGGAEVHSWNLWVAEALGWGHTHNPNIKLHSRTQPHRISIPRNITIRRRKLPHIICPYNACKTHYETRSKKKSDNDTLAEGQVEAENDGDGEEDHPEVVADVEATFD